MSPRTADNANAAQGWKPAKARFIVSRFSAPCLWCGEEVPADTEIVYYPDERATGHTACHEEASG